MRIWLAISIIGLMVLGGCTATEPAGVSTENLKVITEDYPPFNFIDKDGNITGQSTEIVMEIMRQAGVKADIEIMPLSEGLDMAQNGPATAIYSINRTTERDPLYKWVGPIGSYEQAFYAMKGTKIDIDTIEDLKALSIGVYKGDAGNQFLASLGFTNLDESLTDDEALKKLADGKVQLWLGNTKGLAITAAAAGVNVDNLVRIPEVVVNADLYIAFSKDVSDATITKWQSILDSLKTDQDIDGKTFVDKIYAEYDDPEYVESLIKQD